MKAKLSLINLTIINTIYSGVNNPGTVLSHLYLIGLISQISSQSVNLLTPYGKYTDTRAVWNLYVPLTHNYCTLCIFAHVWIEQSVY